MKRMSWPGLMWMMNALPPEPWLSYVMRKRFSIMDNERTLVTSDGWIHAVSPYKPATSEMVLVLAITALQCMLITSGPDLILDIQWWSGLQNIWSVDWLSKSTHVYGIVTLDRLNAFPAKCGQLLMQLWKPINELSCSLSVVWLGDTLSSSTMVWNMVKSHLGSDLEIFSIISLAIYPRPVISVTSDIVVAV